MTFILQHLLSLILFVPALGALLVLVLPKDEENLLRWVAFLVSLFPLGFALLLWYYFNPNQPGFQFEEVAPWFTVIKAGYHLGVDGISLPMVLLTTLLTPLSILFSFSIK